MATGTAASDYLENKLLDHALGVAAFTMPTLHKVHLYTVAPTDAGGGTEVQGGGYLAQTVAFGAASGGSASNFALVNFGTATADWGAIVAVAIKSGANFLFLGAMEESKIVKNGDSFDFPIGTLTVQLD